MSLSTRTHGIEQRETQVSETTTTTMTDIIEKVRKLLALAKSTDIHEAAAAAAKAQTLIDKHRIDTAALLEDPESNIQECTDHPLFPCHRALTLWKWDLAWELAAANGCQPWWDGQAVYCVGVPDDARAVQYLFAYLSMEIDRLAHQRWKHYQRQAKRPPTARVWKESFRNGAVEEIGVRFAKLRLAEQRKRKRQAKAASNAALVRLENALDAVTARGTAVQAWMTQHGLDYGEEQEDEYRHAQAFDAGRKAGAAVSLTTEGRHALDT